MSTDKTRCAWLGSWAVSDDPIYRDYHDLEWGVPCCDEQQLFELLCLEGAQAGLSWITVLKKRENYRIAFEGFNIEQMSRYDESDVSRLMANPGIIRNQAKIRAAIGNAAAWIRLRNTQDDVVRYLWSFVGGAPFVRSPESLAGIPASTRESDAMSSALRRAGFKFVGSTICYAFMQASGMVNDHTRDCFCHSRH